MKLAIVIPAFNEEGTIEEVLSSIPQKISGIKEIIKIVVDDFSADQTGERASVAGADIILRNDRNIGLAKTFMAGIKRALKDGADIIVTIDADGQYNSSQISDLAGKIIAENADLVNGDRQVDKLRHMKLGNKYGNVLGSFFIRVLTGCKLNDVSSGFRAYSRRLAESFYVLSDHTYTHETVMFAFYNNFKIVEVPVDFYARKVGSSKLINTLLGHIGKSLRTIFTVFFMYRGVKFFIMVAGLFAASGILLFLRYLYFYLNFAATGHIQSLILASSLISLAAIFASIGIVILLLRINRKLFEDIASEERHRERV